MKNRRGFTLIELLAVIIILGVLMLIAIPSVTEYIGSSKKKVYLSTASSYIDATANKVNNLDLPITDTDTTYYVPIGCISLEKGGKSPYGEWTNAYVVVTTDGTKYSYYWTSIDAAGYAIPLTYSNSLNTDSIVTNLADLDLSVGVGGRSNIVVFNANGTIATTANATSTIADNSSLSEGTLAASTDSSCFDYLVIDQAYILGWSGADTMEDASSWIMDVFYVDTADLLGNVVITGYNQFMTDGTTACPTEVVIPSKIEGKSVAWINNEAFSTPYEAPTNSRGNLGKLERLSNNIRPVINDAQEITKVTLPNTILMLGYRAFYDNSIESVNIPSSLRVIGIEAFSQNMISSIVIPSTVVNILNNAFSYNDIDSLVIQNGVGNIADGAFIGNDLTSVSIPGSVSYIGQEAFSSNSISTLTIAEGLEKIDADAFTYNSLTTVTLPSSFNYLCDDAFDDTVSILPSTPHWSTGCCNCAW